VREAPDTAQLLSQDERTMAMLAHILQVVGWWMAPLIIFLIRRESRFTSFHALQALLLQIIYLVFVVGFMVLWFGSFVLTMVHHTPAKDTPPPLALFIVAPLLWLGLIGMWIVMLVIAIVYGLKAGRGEWAEYPLLGRLSRKILNIGPGGTALYV
jgi:uncharacterized Tic20 family protein